MAGPVRAAVVVTGDEVLHGRVGERNAAHLCAWLESRGVLPERVTVLPDDAPVITAQVRAHIAEGVQLIITSGGLGGTHDDITMAAVAEAAGVGMELRGDVLTQVEGRVRGMPVAGERVAPDIRAAANRKQATLPVGSRALPPVGTAAGCVLPVGPGRMVVVLPGPPFELQPMWAAAVTDDPGLRALLEHTDGQGRRVLRLAGVVETQMIEALRDLGPAAVDGLRLGICARWGELELTVADDGRAGAAAGFTGALRQRFGGALFSEDGARVEDVVAAALTRRGHTLGLAESCTGGMLGERLTGVPGASTWFNGGVVSYRDTVKTGVLGVDPDIIATHGAVSAECARAMALGARHVLGADWAVSVTGIAGPGGGSPGKPVGTVFIGVSGPDATMAGHHRFRGDRDQVRQRAVAVALHVLRRALTGDTSPPGTLSGG